MINKRKYSIGRKNAFTLVELLAVIVILAIILVIAVPKVMEVISDATKASLESSAKMVASQVENQYTVAQTLGKEFGDTGSCMEEWAGLNDADYESCTYEITSNGEAKVTIGGKGKFKGLSVCNATRSTATAIEGECEDNSGVAYIENLLEEAAEENGLIVDDTDDQNIRYVGANPSNKVYFNCKDTHDGKSYGSEGYDYANACETWRIIGVFNVKTNISDASGTKRIKIVRDAFTKADGNVLNMSWDSSASNVNNGRGINEWSQADLKSMLNGYYLGASSTCAYCNGDNQGTCENDCTSDITPLSTTSQKMIGQAVWSTRAVDRDNYGYTAKEMYETEQTSTLTGKECTQGDTGCNDNVERKAEWEGKIGLIYPSDWGYASTDANCTDIANQYGTCYESNWMKMDSWYLTILPLFSSGASSVWPIGPGAGNINASSAVPVGATTYLKSNVQIIDGNGDDKPYILK